jgi:CRP-like cAMP-binding protein
MSGQNEETQPVFDLNLSFPELDPNSDTTSGTSSTSVIPWNDLRASQVLNTWKRLLKLDTPYRYREDVLLFSEGDLRSEALLLGRGIVKLTYRIPSGRESLSRIRYPGEFLDQCSYDLDLPSPVSARTVIPCEVYRIEMSRMNEARERNPEISAFEKRILKLELYNAHMANLQLKNLRASERLYRLFLEIATVLGGRRSAGFIEFVLPLINYEVAELIGVSPSHYKQLRNELEQTGKLQRRERRIMLLALPDQMDLSTR